MVTTRAAGPETKGFKASCTRSWWSPFPLPAGIDTGCRIAWPPSFSASRSRDEPVFKILLAGCPGFLSMMLRVLFCRFRGVMRGMVQVTLRGVRVVGRHFVVAGFVMRRRFAMVPSRVFVMFCRFVMMLCRLLGHESSSSI
jgi:hypothetical protein